MLEVFKQKTLNHKNYFKGSIISPTDIYLGASFENKVFLKDLLISELNLYDSSKDYFLRIIIGDSQRVDVLDDLFELGLKNFSLQFILNRGSFLNYRFKDIALCSLPNHSDCISQQRDRNEIINKKLIFTLVGEDAQAKVRCFCQGTGSVTFNFITVQEHLESSTSSDLIIKSALCNSSKVTTNCLVKVDKGLKNVAASQLNKNLLLGLDSQAVCIPKLEVESEDVICKHGAAVSRIDNDQIFYLQSRGISYCKAKKYLINAFLN